LQLRAVLVLGADDERHVVCGRYGSGDRQQQRRRQNAHMQGWSPHPEYAQAVRHRASKLH
jgi:hypothetical protein